jgi:hypothetical protein
MPPRPITLGILIFWLSSMGWLFWRDFWPALRPGQQPPFIIDLSREAEGKRSATYWYLHRNGQPAGAAHCTTRYHPEEQTYELATRIHFENFKFSLLRNDFEVRGMHNTYHVTPEGELRRIESTLELDLGSEPGKGVADLTMRVQGEVQDRLFRPHWSIRAPDLKLPFLNQEVETEPVEIRSHAGMLNPLQPWNRLLNVRTGQTWRMAWFDPLADSLSSMLPGQTPGVRYLEAGVLETVQDLGWGGKEVSCLVIEYREHADDQDPVARTWVRQADGLVLRQEARRGGDQMTIDVMG